eukprot:1159756-Pelagomonas_calceolata.AAC.5
MKWELERLGETNGMKWDLERQVGKGRPCSGGIKKTARTGAMHTAQGGGAAVLLRTVAHEIQPLQPCSCKPRPASLLWTVQCLEPLPSLITIPHHQDH